MKAQCQCGKSFSVPDELAGKTIRCRACGNHLTVTPTQSAAESPKPAPPQAQRAARFAEIQIEGSVDPPVATELLRACQLVDEGLLHSASIKLERVRPKLEASPATLQKVQQIEEFMRQKRRGTFELAREFTESQSIGRLKALLDGPALNESRPEEVFQLGLELCEKLCKDGNPEGAVEVLRIGVFKSTRDEKLNSELERVQAMVLRADRWKQWRLNTAIVGGTSVVGSAGLLFWAWIVWTSLAPNRIIAVPGMIAGALLLLTLPKLVPLLEKKLANSSLQNTISEKISRRRSR